MQFKDRARHGVFALFLSAIAISCVVILLVVSNDEVMLRTCFDTDWLAYFWLQGKTALKQGGSVSTKSTTAGTTNGEADIYFGAEHLDNSNVAEKWLQDDQVSAMNVGGNGPVTRNEGMYNKYTSSRPTGQTP